MHVLIIDDNRSNLDLAAYLLEAFGHSAVAVDNAVQALAEARRGRYDLVLVDIKLPDTDGYRLARDLKGVVGSTPIIAFTALAMAGDRVMALNAGFDDYIAKPIDPDEFVLTLERINRR